MEDVTKVQVDTAIRAYSMSMDSYLESVSSLTVKGKSVSRVDFARIFDVIKQTDSFEKDDILIPSEE